MEAAVRPITRQDYQRNRLDFLGRLVDLHDAPGLEIGAADLPTVAVQPNQCQHADFRSKETLVSLMKLDPDQVPHIDYVVRRGVALSEQIPRNAFAYLVLAHVLEHVPNPIGFIRELRLLLRPGGILLLILPDKRRTQDNPRPVTPVEHILQDFHDKPVYPSLEHIIQYGRCEVAELRTADLATVYRWARKNHDSGLADVHCHVWTDADFFSQLEQLSEIGLLGDLKIVDKWFNQGEFNEFMVALKADQSA